MKPDKEKRAQLVEKFQDIPIQAGVYQIRNKVNGKLLVDSTPNLKSLNGRSTSLQLGSDRNAALQREWNEFGADSFAMEILEVLKPNDNPYFSVKDELKKLEEQWMNKLQPYGDRGYHVLK